MSMEYAVQFYTLHLHPHRYSHTHTPHSTRDRRGREPVHSHRAQLAFRSRPPRAMYRSPTGDPAGRWGVAGAEQD